MEMENLGKQTGTTDTSITNRLQEMEERISGVEDMVEETESSVNESVKPRKFLKQHILDIWDIMKKKQIQV